MYRGPGEKHAESNLSIGGTNVISEPPLGQTTVVPLVDGKVHFKIVLQPAKNVQEDEWEVVLWHNFTGSGEWTSLEYFQATKPFAVSLGEAEQVSASQSFHEASLSLTGCHSGPLYFTIKYRSRGKETWTWANESLGVQDGEIIPKSNLGDPKLGDLIDNMDTSIRVKSEVSEATETELWSLSTKSTPAEGSKSGFSSVRFGTPRNSSRWMALVRIWSPWLAPEQGGSTFKPSKDAVLCSFLLQNGLHLVLLGLSGIDDVLTVFRADEKGNVLIESRNDSTEAKDARVLVSFGEAYEAAVAAVMYKARRIVKREDYPSVEVQNVIRDAEKNIEPQWFEDWYDGLTYCTWNGLGQDLTEEKIFNALKKLEESNVHVTNLIIDDNWQSLDNEGESQFKRGWSDFEANPEGFPNGLKSTVSEIRKRHPRIKHISVWHAILGYWGGIAPEGKIASNYKTVGVDMKTGQRPPGGRMTVVDEEDVPRMYEDFYKFLSESGIDSVKTDAQFFLDELDEADVRRRLIKTYQDAWTVSSLKWFSVKLISCMSQTPQILFHSQLPDDKPRILVRNSDDFFPEIPASHAWHVFCNAHNALLTQYLNVLPDWDMFQTFHAWSTFHGAARCLSGGPTYITDEPGKHDMDLIHQMTAQTVRGNTVILRPQCFGRAMLHYTNYDENRLLRIGTYTGQQRSGTGILGLFNISSVPLTELISLADFPGHDKCDEYIVRLHSTGQITPQLHANQKLSFVQMTLPPQTCQILSAYPLQTYDVQLKGASSPADLRIANLGLLGKMTGAAAVVRTTTTVTDAGDFKIKTTLKALGVLGLYLSDLPDRDVKADFLVLIVEEVIPARTVKKSKTSDKVLEIDVETAWKDMGLRSAWSNEVEVEIIMHGTTLPAR